jgi:Peptidase M66
MQILFRMSTRSSWVLGLVLLCGGPTLTACTVVGELDDPRAEPPPTGGMFEGGYALARGVRIRAVSLYQGIKRPLVAAREVADIDSAVQMGETSIPIVAGRNALLRVALEFDGPPDSPMIGRLLINDDRGLDVTEIPTGPAREEDLGSTLNFAVPGPRLVPGASLDLALLAPEDGRQEENPSARFTIPALPIEAPPATLRVMLVPIAYGADGSGRVPSILDTQIQRLQKRLLSLYPVAEVVVSRHAGYESNIRVMPDDRDSWSELLAELQSLRVRDKAADDLYYYGVFAPAPSYVDYYGSTAEWFVGLGYTPRVPSSLSKVAIGLGYQDVLVDTAVHEIGHNHGRGHSPCNIGGETFIDWPYEDGSINAWGYDIVRKELVKPETPDMMGYCPDFWVSAHSFGRLFERITAVANPAASLRGTASIRYERVSVDGNGAARLLPPVTLSSPVSGEPVMVTVESAAGTTRLTGQLIPHDHIGGGIVFVPSSEETVRSVRVEMRGASQGL